MSSKAPEIKLEDTGEYPYKINPPPQDRPVRIYCDGIYDLFHFGHAKALEQAKKAFPQVYLLVGETHKRKGRTVMKDYERYESLRHCKWVDEVIQDAPWTVDQAFLDKHKVLKIDYVAHDDIPYQSVDADDVYAFVKERGHFLPTKRTSGVSTSDLITRIVRDYDLYLRRNLERGVTPKDLNIGFFKEREIKVKNKVDELKKNFKQTLMIWESKSQELINQFGARFGTENFVGSNPTSGQQSSNSDDSDFDLSLTKHGHPLGGRRYSEEPDNIMNDID